MANLAVRRRCHGRGPNTSWSCALAAAIHIRSSSSSSSSSNTNVAGLAFITRVQGSRVSSRHMPIKQYPTNISITLSVAILVVVSDGVKIWVALRFFSTVLAPALAFVMTDK